MQPDKLKRTEDFSRKLRGYDRNEVDQYVSQVIGQYEELYRENRELALRLQLYTKREDAMAQREKEVEKRVSEAGERAAGIVAMAEKDAERIRTAAKEEGEKHLLEIREELAAEEEKLRECKASVAEFHQMMRSHYAEEIRALALLAEGIPLPEKQPVPEPEPEPEPVPQVLFEDEVSEPPAPPAPVSEFDRVYGNMNYVKEVKQASLHSKK